MGFLQVVKGSEMDAEKLALIWGEPRSERIENGSKVIVRRNEVLIYIKNGKAAEVLLCAGGYIYHSDLESGADMKSYADVFDEVSQKHRNFFDGKETVILSISGGANSPARFGEALAELAESKSIREAPPQNGKWICSRCGTENEHRFCKKCGNSHEPDLKINVEPKPSYNPVPKTEENLWICGRCGTKNNFRFCKNCGSPQPNYH